MAFLQRPTVTANIHHHGLECLNTHERFRLATKLWPESALLEAEFYEEEYAAFFEYVGEEWASLRRHPSEFAVETLDSTIDLVAELKTHQASPRTQLVRIVGLRFVNVQPRAVLRSIELAMRIWLNLNVQSDAAGLGPVYADTSSVEWPSATSPNKLIQGQFRASRSPRSSTQRRIDTTCTAAYLAISRGITISWTANLADHLKFKKRSRVLQIYEHKICLLNHIKSSGRHIIPTPVLEEAIDTLNLLFPYGDTQTKDFLARQKRPFYNLGLCGRERVLDLSRYPVWGERLAGIVDAFNEPTNDLLQAVRDRRNVVNWATFMIAILVLVFTIVSIAFGTVSTVYTIKQYNLGLAQACSARGAKINLAQYCT